MGDNFGSAGIDRKQVRLSPFIVTSAGLNRYFSLIIHFEILKILCKERFSSSYKQTVTKRIIWTDRYKREFQPHAEKQNEEADYRYL